MISIEICIVYAIVSFIRFLLTWGCFKVGLWIDIFMNGKKKYIYIFLLLLWTNDKIRVTDKVVSKNYNAETFDKLINMVKFCITQRQVEVEKRIIKKKRIIVIEEEKAEKLTI